MKMVRFYWQFARIVFVGKFFFDEVGYITSKLVIRTLPHVVPLAIVIAGKDITEFLVGATIEVSLLWSFIVELYCVLCES